LEYRIFFIVVGVCWCPYLVWSSWCRWGSLVRLLFGRGRRVRMSIHKRDLRWHCKRR